MQRYRPVVPITASPRKPRVPNPAYRRHSTSGKKSREESSEELERRRRELERLFAP